MSFELPPELWLEVFETLPKSSLTATPSFTAVLRNLPPPALLEIPVLPLDIYGH
jgi:hypothetical protein